MQHPCPGAHHLHVTGSGATCVTKAVPVRDRALPDIGDNLHIPVRMCAETCPCRHPVIIDDPQDAEPHPPGIAIIGKAEMVAGIQPAMIGMTKPGIRIDRDGTLCSSRFCLSRWR